MATISICSITLEGVYDIDFSKTIQGPDSAVIWYRRQYHLPEYNNELYSIVRVMDEWLER